MGRSCVKHPYDKHFLEAKYLTKDFCIIDRLLQRGIREEWCEPVMKHKEARWTYNLRGFLLKRERIFLHIFNRRKPHGCHAYLASFEVSRSNLSVHFGRDWIMSTAIGWTAMKICTDTYITPITTYLFPDLFFCGTSHISRATWRCRQKILIRNFWALKVPCVLFCVHFCRRYMANVSIRRLLTRVLG